VTVARDAVEAQKPGREVGAAEYVHVCHRYLLAVRIARGRRVLEVACGPGLGVAGLRDVAATYVGGDLAAEHLAMARRSAPGVPFLRLHAEHLPVASGTLQVILALEVAQYVAPGAFLREARRALAADGAVLITLPNCRRPGFAPSPLAREYLDGAAWQHECVDAGLHAQVFGAFREPGRFARVRGTTRLAILAGAARFLNVLDPGHRLATFRRGARRAVGYKPLQLPPVLTDADLTRADGYAITLLEGAELRSARYTFLYVLAARSPAVAAAMRDELMAPGP
jgi:SAM-dependent methyltransferase